jgi:hypothetical protein
LPKDIETLVAPNGAISKGEFCFHRQVSTNRDCRRTAATNSKDRVDDEASRLDGLKSRSGPMSWKILKPISFPTAISGSCLAGEHKMVIVVTEVRISVTSSSRNFEKVFKFTDFFDYDVHLEASMSSKD